ncbi:Mobile element protein [Acidisarcina polymorpha]|uniref:Mobile element protein n=1 Tax=Acidisarcina polymorpha TaxID=2211140 RepID=A0A2Z5G0N3_9BACT|nr:Mobile element protein [Acidisarcina polymorpha]
MAAGINGTQGAEHVGWTINIPSQRIQLEMFTPLPSNYLRRELAEWAEEAHQLSQRRAAGLIPVNRATLRYEHHRDPQDAPRVRLRDSPAAEEGLIVRTQKRKERAQRQRLPIGQAARPTHKWSMDFVAQRLPDGRWIRLNVDILIDAHQVFTHIRRLLDRRDE